MIGQFPVLSFAVAIDVNTTQEEGDWTLELIDLSHYMAACTRSPRRGLELLGLGMSRRTKVVLG